LTFVTLQEILARCYTSSQRAAQAEGPSATPHEAWAVPAFDTLNHETIVATLDGAAAERAPVILMFYPNHTPMRFWPGLVALIQVEAARAGVPVCVQLDHSTSLEQVEAALEAGLSAVMIDGSTLPFEQNVALTRQVVRAAHRRGVSVEAELGHVGTGDEILTADETARRLTRPEEAERFVAETGVDALAVSIGTLHGIYRATPKLDFERLHALQQVVPVPLVLHGGSGTPDDDIRRAIAGGICKVNIWTEVAMAFAGELQTRLASPLEQCRLNQVMDAARQRAQEMVQHKIRLLGAAGRA
jgi:fructose-bisphosphate aldolase class II